MIATSRAGLDMDNRVWEMALGVRDLEQPGCWMDNMEVDSVVYHSEHDEMWTPLYGERSVSLSFLKKGKACLAQIYTDGGGEVKPPTHVKCLYKLVDATQMLKFRLKPRGGAAVRFREVGKDEARCYRRYEGEIL